MGIARYSYFTIQNGLWVGMSIQHENSTQPLVIEAKSIIAINTTTGSIEYEYPVSDPVKPDTWVYRQGPMSGSGYGLFYTAVIPNENEGRGWMAFNVSTGKVAWISEETDYPWGNFWAYMPEPCGYGLIFAAGYSGVYALNVTNGKIVWHYVAESPYFEEPYSSNIAPNGSSYASYSFGSTGPIVGGGIVFAPNTEHSPTFLYRGQQLHAIDAFTGEKVWSIKGNHVPTAIAYGVLLTMDSYNGFTYAFGKGTTKTTVTAEAGINSGVLIRGTVLDTSSAQNGTAAIADEFMTPWMEYLHMQQPKPTNATGVTVRLTGYDPDGNAFDIGTTVCDLNGKYGIAWMPDREGTYHITATFEGSEAYYSSQDTTYIAVGPAQAGASPQPTASPTSPTTSPATSTTAPASPTAPAVTSPAPASPTPAPEPGSDITLATYAAIAAAVIIAVIVAVALLLKRRTK